jgi:hypothetical protein
MLKRVILVLAVAMVAASLFAGGDPWKDKPYKQWDANDIKKILFDSPWAKQVSVVATWKPSSGSAITSVGANSSAQGGSMGGNIERSAQDPSGAENHATFVVRWESSSVIRQAKGRNAMLAGMSEEKVDQYVNQEPETYDLTLMGNDMTPFDKVDEMALKQQAYLLVKKTKQKLSPDRVEIRRDSRSQRISDIVFHFSKKSASGEATIPADEKQLEFSCETKITKVKTSFDPPKMVSPKGVDL